MGKNGSLIWTAPNQQGFLGGDVIGNSSGGITLRSGETERGNAQCTGSMSYQLVRLCTKIEETLDRVLAGEIACREVGWIDPDAAGDRLIRQIVLKFCLEQYPQFLCDDRPKRENLTIKAKGRGDPPALCLLKRNS